MGLSLCLESEPVDRPNIVMVAFDDINTDFRLMQKERLLKTEVKNRHKERQMRKNTLLCR